MIINIATIPDKDAIDIAELPELTYENKKDYEKKYKSMYLTPLTGKIVCFSYLMQDNYKSKQPQSLVLFDEGRDEYMNFLSSIVNIILEWNNKRFVGIPYTNDPLITFNGKKFDLPFILFEVCRVLSNFSKYIVFKSIIESCLFNTYSITYNSNILHYDMYEILSNFYSPTMQNCKLSQWAKRMDTSLVYGNQDCILEWYENKEYRDITKYCESNIISILELYNRVVAL